MHAILQPMPHLRDPWCSVLRRTILLVILLGASCLVSAEAHEGHDHDQAPALNRLVTPRVVAISPEFELVGVLSGANRLTVFVTHFDTNEPVKGANLSVSLAEQETEAVAKQDGVFELTASWLASTEPLDIVFRLTLPDGEDLLTGRLEKTVPTAISIPATATISQRQGFIVAAAALFAGIFLALLATRILAWRQNRTSQVAQQASVLDKTGGLDRKAKQLQRAPVAVLALALACSLTPSLETKAQGAISLPSVPATMATDAPQRMPDGSLFVPKATQHLLAVRTILTKESEVSRTVQLVGTVIADPNSFGRVQSGHTGRIEAPEVGLAFVGKRVEKGDLLAYLQHHIEAYNKGSLQGEIAELEARIALEENKLALYRKHPEVIPAVKILEAEGGLRALRQKRNELLPTLSEHEEIRAPISGVISSGNVVAGQVVDAREILFEIVDPGRFWVEAIAHDSHILSNLGKASAILTDGETLPLEFVGMGLTLKQQAAPLSFRVREASPNLSIGKPVSVLLQSTAESRGIVLPTSSVVRAQSGLPAVWIKTDAERFEPRTIRYEPLDGQKVVVLSRLAIDLRVVTEGASLLNQVR
jgi:multidrug efflux pump subunit AcrA (membrane-fusion protein)